MVLLFCLLAKQWWKFEAMKNSQMAIETISDWWDGELGKGLLALPADTLNPAERISNGCDRNFGRNNRIEDLNVRKFQRKKNWKRNLSGKIFTQRFQKFHAVEL
jgi:hypothetical protein